MRGRIQAVLIVVMLLTAACGARLSNEERAVGAGALTAGGGGAGSGSLGEFGNEEFSTDGGTSSDGTGGGPGGSSTGARGRAGAGGGPGQRTGQSGSQPRGDLKATDTGVTPEKVVVATIADISGIQPGLFKSVHDAAKAATAYINSQGGINGRQLDLRLLDSKTDSGANRAAVLEACQKAFAIVGSMSAFDDGGAKAGQECGIPDMSAITTNAPRYQASNVYPAFPNAGPLIATSNAAHLANRFPEQVKQAGILYLNQAVTRNNALARVEAWESVGFDFIYEREVQVVEADYSRFVLEMQAEEVQYVTMVGDYQNLVRLQKSMRQQGYVPQIRDWDSVAYDPGYLSSGGEAVEGSLVFLNSALFEEAAQIPEMRLYEQWLRRAAPGAKITYFGLYAWSAFRLFQQQATEIGPDLTRKKMFDRLKSVPTWNGHGIHAPHEYGAKKPSQCFLYVEVKGNAFTRTHPGSGFSCNEGGLYQLRG